MVVMVKMNGRSELDGRLLLGDAFVYDGVETANEIDTITPLGSFNL